MREEFPDIERHNRLRCYGFGTPDLHLALWSASNSATLIIQGTLHPFTKEGNEIKTSDMHLHRLPWPKKRFAGPGWTHREACALRFPTLSNQVQDGVVGRESTAINRTACVSTSNDR